MKNFAGSLRYYFSQTRTLKYSGNGFDFQTTLHENGKQLSFWHDIQFKTLSQFDYNVIIEIPKFHLAKYEMAKNLINNPIVQDTRKNRFTGQHELRYYAMFPYFNYGFVPQTWENALHQEQGYKGDDDPLDVVELSERQYKIGEEVKVRVLGCLCVLDQNEIDWKLLCLNCDDADKMKVKTIQDLESIKPGLLFAIKNWFKNIKTYDGKKQNIILYDESPHDPQKACQIIDLYHEYWKQLMGISRCQNIDYLSKRKEFNIVVV